MQRPERFLQNDIPEILSKDTKFREISYFRENGKREPDISIALHWLRRSSISPIVEESEYLLKILLTHRWLSILSLTPRWIGIISNCTNIGFRVDKKRRVLRLPSTVGGRQWAAALERRDMATVAGRPKNLQTGPRLRQHLAQCSFVLSGWECPGSFPPVSCSAPSSIVLIGTNHLCN